MGLGRFGGGLGVTKWFLEQGSDVILTDLATTEELEIQLRELGSHEKLTLVLGEHREEDFVNTDLVIANPAVSRPWDNPYLKRAWENDVQVTTEIELVVARLPREQIIGVTGTSGKSTTVSMIHAAILASGICSHLAGNIGGSILNNLDSVGKYDVVILELSSAMLWWLHKNDCWSPHVAVLTNIKENHLDWHGSFDEYSRCKRFLFEHQTDQDVALTQDPKASFANLSVLGKHNELNAAVAFLAAIEMGADTCSARKAIQEFSGLPHRLQKVSNCFYNDSKSTTPLATKLAVDSFDDPSKIHLIVGGYDKKVDLTLLAGQSSRVAKMYAIGETASAIVQLAGEQVQNCVTLERAVEVAMQSMGDGDTLVLSPGCASWDQFANYEKRGELFCSLINSALHQQVR